MKTIEPNAFYETSELKEILKGRFKIATLNSHGLLGCGKGYWGQNIIDSINECCRVRLGDLAAGKERKNGRPQNTLGLGVNEANRAETMEGQLQRSKRLKAEIQIQRKQH